MYNYFKRIFWKQMVREISVATDMAARHAHESGYEFGYRDGLKKNEEMIEKRAMDLYTKQNYLVNPNQVFQVTKTNIPYLGMEPIKKEKLKELQHQANYLLDTELWGILTTRIRDRAIDLAVKTSQNWDNVIGGKMMVHNLSLIENLVIYLAKLDLSTIPDASGGVSKDVH